MSADAERVEVAGASQEPQNFQGLQDLQGPHEPQTPFQNSFEASLAPREGELLSLPFDQYGRMRIVQNVALALYGEIAGQVMEPGVARFALQVLDIGGYPGVLRHFLPGDAYNIMVLDVVPDDGSIPGYRQGSGLDLPFADASFDVVTSLDTLEHIPANHRERFLEELMRVARYGAVLVNPVQSTEADLAEETLNEYIRWILDAQQEQLAEHRQYGLPDFPATVEAFRQDGWQTAHFTTANVYNWLFMMVAKHYLISMRDEKAAAFERTLDRFYNLTFSEADRAAPAYRGVLVAVKPGLEGALRRIEELYPPVATSRDANTERLQLSQLLMNMLDLKAANHEDRLLREQMERRDKHIAGMETRIALQDVTREQLNAQNRGLVEQSKDLQNAIEQTREHYEAQLANRQADAEQFQARIQAEFKRHEDYIARLEGEQRSKDEHILYLERLLQGVEAGRVMRLTRAVSRFLGRG